jgi:hypothetical protein
MEKFLQQVIIQVTNKLFVILFPEAKVTRQIIVHHNRPVTKQDTKEPVDNFVLKLTPQDFKISRNTIAGLLVINHVLPDNFYQLTVKDDPRAIRLSQEIIEPIDTL